MRGQPVRGTPSEDMIVQRTVSGESIASIAENLGVGTATVSRVRADKADMIRELIESRRLEVHRHADQHFAEVLDATVAAAKDKDNRNQPGQTRNYAEMLGLIGKNGVNVHVGDVVTNNTQINLDPEVMARMAREYDPEEHARLARKLGLG